MPKIIADGAKGAPGGQGFDFNSPAQAGNPGQMANCNWIDDDCAQTGGSNGAGASGSPSQAQTNPPASITG